MNEPDLRVLRDLAHRIAEAAADPVMDRRREMWRCHHRLERVRPMVLVFPEGAWRELIPQDRLDCENLAAREIELGLRKRLYTSEHFDDDTVLEPDFVVHKAVTPLEDVDWGLAPRRRPSPQETGSWGFEPVIHSAADLRRLRVPQIRYDEKATVERLETAHELFDEILKVRLKGVDRIGFHITKLYADRRGLEPMLWDMSDNPGLIDEAMTFFREGYKDVIRQYEDQSLLDVNNDLTYNHTGGCGYTTELPHRGWQPDHVRPRDMWSFAESQELAGCSPEQHERFALRHERELLAPFGLVGYGCCEPLHDRIESLESIPNLRMISISPFSDVGVAAEKLGDRYVFSWKPNPAQLVGSFDSEAVERSIRHTLDVTAGCVIQMVLKDTHTCEGRPERFTEWTRIAKRLAEEY